MSNYPRLDATGLTELVTKLKAKIMGEGYVKKVTASYEESPTLYAHSSGEYIFYDGYIYKTISSIAQGANLVIDTNISLAVDVDLTPNTPIYITNIPDTVTPGGVILVDSAGVEYTRRDKIKFGNGFTVTDDTTNSRMQVDLPNTVAAIPSLYKNYGDYNLAYVDSDVPKVSYTKNGLSITLVGGRLSIQGTATEFTSIDLVNSPELFEFKYSLVVPPGTYRVGGCPAGGDSSNGYYMSITAFLDYQQAYQTVIDTGEGGTVTIGSNYTTASIGMRFCVNSGTVISTKMNVYPYIIDSRIPETDWIPGAMSNRQLTDRVKELREYIDDQIDTAITQVLNTSY